MTRQMDYFQINMPHLNRKLSYKCQESFNLMPPVLSLKAKCKWNIVWCCILGIILRYIHHKFTRGVKPGSSHINVRLTTNSVVSSWRADHFYHIFIDGSNGHPTRLGNVILTILTLKIKGDHFTTFFASCYATLVGSHLHCDGCNGHPTRLGNVILTAGSTGEILRGDHFITIFCDLCHCDFCNGHPTRLGNEI